MRVRRMMLLLLILALALPLAACGGRQPANDPEAAALAEAVKENESEMFPFISDVKELPSPVCVVAEQGAAAWFLESDALPIAPAAEAAAVLYVRVYQDKQDRYRYEASWASPDGAISVGIASGKPLEKPAKLAETLAGAYSFGTGDTALLADIQAYETDVLQRDYLSAVNACKNDYDKAGSLSSVSAIEVSGPLVYMMDEDFLCTAIDEGTMAFIPAEWKQYVPPLNADYVRPEISGKISLGVSPLGGSNNNTQTIAGVREKLMQPAGAFCFAEVVGLRSYGTFTSKTSGVSDTAYSYVMRMSAISPEGELLGCSELSYAVPAGGMTDLGQQMMGMSLARDKNGTAVFGWSYESAFQNALGN